MRILHILDHSLPLHSGYVFRTVSLLREQRARGWETIQLTTPRHTAPSTPVEEVEGWIFHRTEMAPKSWHRLPAVLYVDEMRATARRLDELIRRYKPDVVHAHSPVLNVLPAIRVARRHRIPVVYELRALWEDAAVDHGTTAEGSLRYRVSRALESYALHHVDHITTICEGLRHDITLRGVEPERITVIPNAVDPHAFQLGGTPDVTLRRRLGLEGATVLGFAGSFYGYEGLDLLIDAVSQLISRRPDLRVLLVGGGPQEQALRKQARDLGIESRVVFAGRVPHIEVQHYYDLIDVLVYPRRAMRLTEIVTPLKPLEAMAQGRVLIASDVGGHRELVRDGETGFLFRAGDVYALAAAIEAVLAQRAGWDAVRSKARRFVETERTWASSAARYVQVYRQLPSRGRARLAV